MSTKQLTFPDQTTDKPIESLWSSILSKPENKNGRFFLLDIDNECESAFEKIKDLLFSEGVFIADQSKTPNGYHLITEPFNTNLIEGLIDTEIKRDALFFLESWEVD